MTHSTRNSSGSVLTRKGRLGGECRRQLHVRGQVQGVGFRPFIYRLAHEIGIAGTVCNDASGVQIEARGTEEQLDVFERRIADDAPALACVESVERAEFQSDSSGGEGRCDGFVIIASDQTIAERGRVTVDSAMCGDCLREMFDEEDRRYRHALINCTNCGPRYTIVQDLPYDRPLTTMASFAMCDDCEREYVAPGDRRFHAQPTCCADCGPVVTLVDCAGNAVEGDPFAATGRLLGEGFVIAMKGLGGYHLVVDATNGEAVRRLRRLKDRDRKAFAIMVHDIERAHALCELSDEVVRLLSSPVCPIVIARRKNDQSRYGEADEIAPGQERLGLMIPYTPMQHLLMREVVGPLVMTSANRSDDPLVIDDGGAKGRLKGIADYYLAHNRPIERAVDDSIYLDGGDTRGSGEGAGLIPIRRARGLVPMPTGLPIAAARPGLCVGADLKNAIAIVRGGEAVVSQHIGDLRWSLAYDRFMVTIDDLQRLFDVRAEWVAVDLHPRYLSRRYGLKRAHAEGLPIIEVQHHHAHLASVMAEHDRTEKTIGIICDGVGYGTDRTAWGGEILFGDLVSFARFGHLRRLRLPGEDAAAKRTGRCALSWMADALGLDEVLKRDGIAKRVLSDERERQIVLRMLARDLNCPASTGMGRLFDGASALLGLCYYNEYESMSGQMLESAAMRARGRRSGAGLMPIVYGEDAGDDGCFEIDTRPMVCALVEEMERRGGDGASAVDELAWIFHDGIADGLVRGAKLAREVTGLNAVALSGGVFCNALLAGMVRCGLEEEGFEVLMHRELPPNDGGIAYGQAAVAAARLARGSFS